MLNQKFSKQLQLKFCCDRLLSARERAKCDHKLKQLAVDASSVELKASLSIVCGDKANQAPSAFAAHRLASSRSSSGLPTNAVLLHMSAAWPKILLPTPIDEGEFLSKHTTNCAATTIARGQRKRVTAVGEQQFESLEPARTASVALKSSANERRAPCCGPRFVLIVFSRTQINESTQI